jgi:hypothetical protein
MSETTYDELEACQRCNGRSKLSSLSPAYRDKMGNWSFGEVIWCCALPKGHVGRHQAFLRMGGLVEIHSWEEREDEG